VNRRHRWAAVASTLALVTAGGLGVLMHADAYVNSQVVSDPAGDASTIVDAQGHTTPTANEPRADVVSASASYTPGSIVLSVRTAQTNDPRTDSQWTTSDSALSWFLDTTNDKKFDYHVLWGVDGANLYADVMAAADDNTPVCTGTPSLGADGSYVVTLNPQCFGNPAAFNWGGRMEYGATGSQIMDRFPDGDGNYFGPVALNGTAPAPTPPPTTPVQPTPPPATGGTPAPVPVPVTTPPVAPPRPIVAAPVAADEGFWLLGRDGGVFSFGTARFFGSIGNVPLNKQIVGMAAKPDGSGYWFVASDGGIFAYKAPFWGSTGNLRLAKPIVGMAATPSGQGYWLVASDGGIFSFGDAGFYGSTGAIHLNQPIVGMAATPSGKGYWLVASDGGIFAFGDAAFFGSTGNIALNQPIVGMTASPTGRGYWFVARDGGVFAFGDARFLGSAVTGSAAPVVAMAATKTGAGYRIARADGSIAAFGNATPGGGLTGALAAPVVAIATAS
jgi:ribosomal protein L24E